MKYLKGLLYATIATISLTSCGPDDDNGTIPVRDRAEVEVENQAALNSFLQTHFWNYEEYAASTPGAPFEIVLDTIEGVNAAKTPLSSQVETRTLEREGIDYTYYVLRARQGGGSLQPSFADSVLVSYRGSTLDGRIFDSAPNGLWLDLTNSIDGFMEGVTQFNVAASNMQNGDGTIDFQDSGVGAVFFPSGIGYFNRVPINSGIDSYSSLLFTFQVLSAVSTDHDGDGILSQYEDLNGDRSVKSAENLDNTDEDFPIINNYQDTDDDNDGILTRDENPDPNGDGNPDDAQDSDGDGTPDYLDPNS